MAVTNVIICGRSVKGTLLWPKVTVLKDPYCHIGQCSHIEVLWVLISLNITNYSVMSTHKNSIMSTHNTSMSEFSDKSTHKFSDISSISLSLDHYLVVKWVLLCYECSQYKCCEYISDMSTHNKQFMSILVLWVHWLYLVYNQEWPH